MRPLFNRSSLWVYPVYASIGGSVGYWLSGVESRQINFLSQRREALMDKRRRRAEREGIEGQGVLPGEENAGEGGSSYIGGGKYAGRTGVGQTQGEGRHAGMGQSAVMQQGQEN